MRYKIGRSQVIVTKPNGDVQKMEGILFYDTKCDTLGVLVTEECAVQGYSVEILQRELKAVRDLGHPVEVLPQVVRDES